MDECTLDQRADLCEFFAGVVELNTIVGHYEATNVSKGTRGHGLVKLFVASRKEPDIERAFQRRSFPTIQVEATKVDHDIELYVKAQIRQRLNDGSLTLDNIMLEDKILTTLTKNAGGMYVFLIINYNYLPFYIQVDYYIKFLIKISSIGFSGLSSN